MCRTHLYNFTVNMCCRRMHREEPTSHLIITPSGLLLQGFCFLPALFNVLCLTTSAELHGGGIHDDVTDSHADHVVVVDGADADAVQVGQGHHKLLSAHRAPVGVLPFILKQYQASLLTHGHV